MESHLRTDVQAAPLPVGFGAQLGGKLSIGVVGDVVNGEVPVLGYGVDAEGTGVGLIKRGSIW